MTREEAKEELIQSLTENHIPDPEAVEMAIKLLEQEPVCDRLAREYISKVKCCDECFASTFCTINGLRNSRVPQDYCVKNIERYFGDKAILTGTERINKE